MIEIIEFIDDTGEEKSLGKTNGFSIVPSRNDLINLKFSGLKLLLKL